MYSTSLDLFVQRNAFRAYAGNIGRAARTLLEALLGYAPSTAAVRAPLTEAAPATEREKQKGRLEMFRIAEQYERLSPGLSAELRSIASRD
jgi:hypothetical protein